MSQPKDKPRLTKFDCKTQSTEHLIEMFVDITQRRRLKLGQKPAERPVLHKLHGVAHGPYSSTNAI